MGIHSSTASTLTPSPSPRGRGDEAARPQGTSQHRTADEGFCLRALRRGNDGGARSPRHPEGPHPNPLPQERGIRPPLPPIPHRRRGEVPASAGTTVLRPCSPIGRCGAGARRRRRCPSRCRAPRRSRRPRRCGRGPSPGCARSTACVRASSAEQTASGSAFWTASNTRFVDVAAPEPML